ncbi:efflux RND transporter periplasmic adaptor subunit [Leptospira idonii]|uniref:Efflux RND transporter periplasmic adaptor subunit n=1 Tax=Leptospira idonii TaxID=1193500 RepID=A0A4R9LVW9_9LEPT|nr:efflux RND transporter periplasmic adaptor subunit [Leptospira idonii]TGN16947.1 efflux RND transporter periplasmic adaptor subunit [Leptospira idonii]
MLKEKLGFLGKIPFFSKVVISGLIYLGISLAYSNLTWGNLRAKLPFFNRMFYSKHLSAAHYYETFTEPKSDENNSETTDGALSIQALKVHKEMNTPVLSYSAVLEPVEKVEIYSKVSGRLETLFVKEGDRVTKGQKLAKLDSMTFELDLAKQRAALGSSQALYQLSKDKLEIARRNVEIKLGEADKRISLYNKAEAEWERFSEILRKKEILHESKAITDEEMENLRLELNSREINVSNAKRDLEMILVGIRDEDIVASGYSIPSDKKEKIEVLKTINTKIEKSELEVALKNLKSSEVNLQTTEMLIKESVLNSPMDGVIAKVNRTSGELINAGSGGALPILTVISVNSVYVAFSVNEGDLSKMKEGLKADVKADVLPNKTFRGIVKKISPMIDQKTHTADVKIELTNQSSELRPGMFVRSDVIIGKETESILIPINALVTSSEEEGFVFIIREKRAYKTKVSLGSKKEERVEVINGLEEGDTIALSPINRLHDGILVFPNFSSK